MKLTRLEQETIITLNEEEKFAEVYTASPVLMRKFDKYTEAENSLWTVMEEFTDRGEVYAKKYRLADKKLAYPREKKRAMSEAQRQASAERLRTVREARS